MARDQRIRDPVHGLIVFREDEPLDQLAWSLLDCPEFQRLRRIKQLGVSEFVFPGATHTRFAHCIGVFHVARELIKIVKRELERGNQEFDGEKAATAVVAALLHDIGHGPLSHTFEGVLRRVGILKRHELWSGEIIESKKGKIRKVLENYRKGMSAEVAALLKTEDPKDIYHAVVSSSFDADRLDYLRRDRLMTGTHAGDIDFDWLMEHVRVADIQLELADEDARNASVQTFCLAQKALPAAEQFLLARYTLHEQVYFHKTTRCVEHMIQRLLTIVAKHCLSGSGFSKIALKPGHPLREFFSRGGDTLKNYLVLDDVVLMGAIYEMASSEDREISEIAKRLMDRRLYKTLDLSFVGSDEGTQKLRARRIDNMKFRKYHFKDESAKNRIYSEIGGDEDRMHKRLHVLDGDVPTEISRLSKIIDSLAPQRTFTRYYFESESDRDKAMSK